MSGILTKARQFRFNSECGVRVSPAGLVRTLIKRGRGELEQTCRTRDGNGGSAQSAMRSISCRSRCEKWKKTSSEGIEVSIRTILPADVSVSEVIGETPNADLFP